MKAERGVFVVLTLYLALVTPIYYFVSHEIIGTVALTLTGTMMLMIALFLQISSRKIDVPISDRPDAEIYQGAGEVGFFAPKSIWPFWCALTLAILLLGPVFGWWLSLLGIGMGVWSVSGWLFEFYRGDYAH